MLKRLILLVVLVIIILGVSSYFFVSPEDSGQATISKDEKLKDPKAEKLYQVLQKVNYIAQGSDQAVHKAYVIFDPNCMFCHAFSAAAQKAITEGEFEVRWVPVGIIKPSSPYKAIAILSATDPLAALMKNEDAFNYKKDDGGIEPLMNPTPQQVALLKKNMNELKGLVNAVPMIVYKNNAGNARISGGAKLPLRPDKASLSANEKKVDAFIQATAGRW